MHRNDDYMRRALMTVPPTGDEAMSEIAVIVDGPRGRGRNQAAVWYSKLTEIGEVVQRWRQGHSKTGGAQ